MIYGVRLRASLLVILSPFISAADLPAQNAQTGPLINPQQHSTILHAEFRRDLVFVACEINGVPGLRCLLDTGSSMSGLSPALVKRLHLTVKNQEGDSATSPLAYSLDPFNVSLGGSRYTADRASVAPLQMVTDAVGEPVDALLGTSLFENFQVTIDSSTSEVRLAPPGTPLLYPVQRQQIILPLHVAICFVKLLNTEHHAIVAPFLLDTGSIPPMILSPSFWKEHPGLATQPQGTADNDRLMTVNAINIFGRELKNIAAREPIQPSGVLASRLTGGIVGAPVLNRHFIITYDFSRGAMYTVPLLNDRESIAEPK